MMFRLLAGSSVVLLCLWGCAGKGATSKAAPAVVVRISALTAERLDAAFRAVPNLRPQTVEAEGSIAAVLEGHTPLAFATGRPAVPADLNHVRWVSHCKDLVQLPVAA